MTRVHQIDLPYQRQSAQRLPPVYSAIKDHRLAISRVNADGSISVHLIDLQSPEFTLTSAHIVLPY